MCGAAMSGARAAAEPANWAARTGKSRRRHAEVDSGAAVGLGPEFLIGGGGDDFDLIAIAISISI